MGDAGVMVCSGSETGRGESGGSGGDAFAVMMKSADLRHFDHSTAIGGLDLTRLWAVHLQRAMSSPSVAITEVGTERALQVLLVDHNDVVEALPANCPDHALREWVLPRTSRGGHDLLESHSGCASAENLAEDLAPIAQEIQ